MEITKYKNIDKGFIKATVSINLESGWFVNDIVIFQKGDRKWATMPSRKYEKDGETKFFPYTGLIEREMSTKFQKALFEKIEEYVATMEEPTQSQEESDGMPF